LTESTSETILIATGMGAQLRQWAGARGEDREGTEIKKRTLPNNSPYKGQKAFLGGDESLISQRGMARKKVRFVVWQLKKNGGS